jgi:small basic protein
MRKHALTLAVLALPIAAHAALPAAVTTAFTDAASDSGLVWSAMIAVAVVGVGFKLGIIGLKKAPSAAK